MFRTADADRAREHGSLLLERGALVRWSPRGAHLLLQVRTRVLNNDLAADFQRWYAAFAAHSPVKQRRTGGVASHGLSRSRWSARRLRQLSGGSISRSSSGVNSVWPRRLRQLVAPRSPHSRMQAARPAPGSLSWLG